MSSLPRYYVEKVKTIDADANTGIVKLTFTVGDQGSEESVVQLVVSVPLLHEIFGEIDNKMQSAFAGGLGRAGRRPPGKMKGPAHRNAELPDITGD